MKFFTNCQNLDELKTQYRKLCMKHYPDLGGDEETMKALNAEYEYILKHGFTSQNINVEAEIAFRVVLEKLIVLQNITIEICGNWIWVYGETYACKEQLKEYGLKFATKRNAGSGSPKTTKEANTRNIL